MSDQINQDKNVDHKRQYNNENYLYTRSEEMAALFHSLTATAPEKEYQPLLSAFPLTRRASPLQQILGMLLYSLIMIFALVGCLLTMIVSRQDNHAGPTLMYSILSFVIALVLAPASTLLSALLFGSWRGTIVSLVSIYGSIQLIHVLNSNFWNESGMGANSFLFLIPVAVVTVLVGLYYDIHEYPHKGKSILTMLAGSTALTIIFSLISMAPNADVAMDNGGLFLCCSVVVLIPVWTFTIVGVEFIIQGFFNRWQQKRRITAAGR